MSIGDSAYFFDGEGNLERWSVVSECKKNGWRTFRHVSSGREFKRRGDCYPKEPLVAIIREIQQCFIRVHRARVAFSESPYKPSLDNLWRVEREQTEAILQMMVKHGPNMELAENG